MTNEVPAITITGSKASSDASRPRNTADMVACWSEADRQRGKHLLLANKPIRCSDKTAWAAVTSLALQLMMQGHEIKPKIVKSWEVQ